MEEQVNYFCPECGLLMNKYDDNYNFIYRCESCNELYDIRDFTTPSPRKPTDLSVG